MATEVASLPRLGRLRVLLIPRNASGVGEAVAAPTVLWSLTNQQEAAWTYAQVSFLPDLPFLLAFEGVRASSVLGLLAVDDVTIFPGQCTARPARAATDPRDCAFDLDFCGWKPINPSSALAADLRPQDWRLADRAGKLGGLRDQTFGLDTGGYAYFQVHHYQSVPIQIKCIIKMEY